MTLSPRTGSLVAVAPQFPSPQLLVWGGARRLSVAGEFACQFSSDPQAPFDGIVVIDRLAADDLTALLRSRRAWLVPVADLSGSNLDFADVCCADASPASLRHAIDELLRVIETLRGLPSGVTDADDDATLLLARVYSRGGTLRPVYDGARPSLLLYRAAGLLETPWTIADRLCSSGWFERTFFDRLHVCPRCASSRLNVREECSACGSPQLAEADFIHHFRCGFQATERHFVRAVGQGEVQGNVQGNVQGDALICPKCRRRLRHFGVDYDRPGSAHICLACDHVDAHTGIGFVCVDCGTHSDGAKVGIRDWHSYTLTAAGEQRLRSGDLRSLRTDAAAHASRAQSLAEHWMRIQSRYGRPSVVLRIDFLRAAAVREEHGDRYLAAARRQAIEIVRGELRDTDLMIEAPESLLVVLPETEPRAADAPCRRLHERLSSLLAIDLGLDIRQIEPRQMSMAAAQ